MTEETVRTAVAARFPAAAGSTPAPAGNEFVIFSKPELGRLDGAELDAVWDLFAAGLRDHDVTVHQTRVMTGPELDSSELMQQHYGVINQISRLGRPALTEAANAELAEHYADTIGDAEVLGGHEFLERFPEVSPYALGLLFANGDVTRLGPGTYAALIRVDGDAVIILNGFHPRQLSFFTAPDTVCAFLHCSSSTAWATLRSKLIGSTDPSRADGDSIRGRLFADPPAYGLSTVSYNFNGVHASAGPLEGLAELQRFFGGELEDWTFAQALTAAGVPAERVAELVANPTLEAGDSLGSAFDLTEEMDAGPAADLLASATPAD